METVNCWDGQSTTNSFPHLRQLVAEETVPEQFIQKTCVLCTSHSPLFRIGERNVCGLSFFITCMAGSHSGIPPGL